MNKRIKKKHKKQILAKLELVESIMNDISTETRITHDTSPTTKILHQEYLRLCKKIIEGVVDTTKLTKRNINNLKKLKKAMFGAFTCVPSPKINVINAYENIDFGIPMHYLFDGAIDKNLEEDNNHE